MGTGLNSSSRELICVALPAQVVRPVAVTIHPTEPDSSPQLERNDPTEAHNLLEIAVRRRSFRELSLQGHQPENCSFKATSPRTLV